MACEGTSLGSVVIFWASRVALASGGVAAADYRDFASPEARLQRTATQKITVPAGTEV